jgi:hypothetical protein
MATTHHAPEEHAVDGDRTVLDHTGSDRTGVNETVSRDQPELTGEAKEKAEEILKDYDSDDRPTVVLPGSHGTVSGTAVSEWLDDDGNPKYGKEDAPGDARDQASEE